MYECVCVCAALIAAISGPIQIEMHSSGFNCFWNVLNTWVLIIECLIFKKRLTQHTFFLRSHKSMHKLWISCMSVLDFSTSPNGDWGVDLRLSRSRSVHFETDTFSTSFVSYRCPHTTPPVWKPWRSAARRANKTRSHVLNCINCMLKYV